MDETRRKAAWPRGVALRGYTRMNHGFSHKERIALRSAVGAASV